MVGMRTLFVAAAFFGSAAINRAADDPKSASEDRP
jgi:hypothetical protein